MTDDHEEVTAFMQAIEAFSEIEDPEERTRRVSKVLHDWQKHLGRLREIREESVNELRGQKRTWRQIAEVIGNDITPERAQQISKGLSGARRKKATDEAMKAREAE